MTFFFFFLNHPTWQTEKVKRYILWGKVSSGRLQGGRYVQSVVRYWWQSCPLLQVFCRVFLPIRKLASITQISVHCFPVNAVLMKTLTFVQDFITSHEAFFKLTCLQKYLKCREQRPTGPNFTNDHVEGPLAFFSIALYPTTTPQKTTFLLIN